jgi:aminocarboxymuconate-semialdehyde decarboxylase
MSPNIYEKMPQLEQALYKHVFWALGWPFETTTAMIRLAYSGVFEDYPDIKFITHHCGGMVPFFERRIRIKGSENLPKFYVDTAVYGSTPALMCGCSVFGSDHILFGTDMPMGSGGTGYGSTENTMMSIERMDISDVDKDKIFKENTKRILKLPL